MVFLNLNFNDVEKALEKYEFSVLQVVARGNEGQEYIVVRMESPEGINAGEDDIRSTLLNNIPIIKQRIEEGRLARVEIETYKAGEMPRHERSSKVKNFLDER